MRISDAFPSKYLKAADIPPGRFVTVTMAHVQLEDVDGDHGGESKPILYFAGKQKGLCLNRINATTIAETYGEDTDNWHGKPLQLFAAKTEFRGKMVPCLRVQVPQQTPAAPPSPAQPQPAAPPPPQPAESWESEVIPVDDIPF